MMIAILLTALSPLAGSSQSKPVLNHIAVYVQNLQKTTAFYRDIVGIDTIPEPFHDGKHTWFAIGPKSHLHLIAGGKESVHDKNGHLCFSVASMETVIQRLDKHNIPYESWAGVQQTQTIRVDGIKQIYFKDPEGNWIEINNDYQE